MVSSISVLNTQLLATPVPAATTAAAVSAPAPKGFTTAKVSLPDLGSAGITPRLAEVRARAQLVDPAATEIKRAGSDPDLRAAFTLYRGLDSLRTLAEAAASSTLNASSRTAAQAQFAKGLSDLQNFVGDAPTSKLILQFGAKVARAESGLVAKAPASYTGKAAVRGERTTPVPGLASDAQLSVTLTKAGRSDTVAVTLADISGPVTLDAVASLLNARIASLTQTDSQGTVTPRYATRFDVVRTNPAKEVPAQYALHARTISNEQLTLADTNAPPAAYALTVRDGAAALRRIDDVTSTLSSQPVSEVPLGNAAATAVDSTGAIYVVGTSRAAIGGQVASAKDDLVLSKYDSNGVLQFARKLGAAGTATGTSLAIDAHDNVYVAGSFDGKLGPDVYRGTDALVLKFNPQGHELFARSYDSAPNDGIRHIAVGADDRVYITGTTAGTLPGQTSAGGQDGFIAEISASSGALVERRQLGTSGTDPAAVLAVAANGDVLTATVENSHAIVRRYNSGDVTAVPQTLDLGGIGTGSITALAIDPATGSVAVAGTTRASLGGTPLKSDIDGFIARLGPDLTVEGYSSLASSRFETLDFADGKIIASGATSAPPEGSRVGITDGLVARFDANTGALEASSSFGAAGKRSQVVGLAVVDEGPGALIALGLRQGPLRSVLAPSLVDKTSLRTGDSFSLQIDGGKAAKITLDAKDDLASLAGKIRAALGSHATVALQESSQGSKLTITAKDKSRIDLQRGPDGSDALGKLALAPGQLRSSAVLFDIGKSAVEVARTPGGSFALDLSTDLTLADAKTATAAKAKIDKALATVQRAYRSLYYDPAREALARQRSAAGAVPAYLSQQLSSYQDALARLQSGTSSYGLNL